MKIALHFCCVLFGVLFIGCTVTERSVEDVGNQFQEGIQGRGHIVPNDPTRDEFGPIYH